MSLSTKIGILLFWILVVVFYALTILAVSISAPVGLIGVFVTFIFVILHGSRLYGLRNTVIFILITFVISWSLESLSIATGFPFGYYFYTGLGKIGEVPWIIMPAYLGTGYLSWVIAHTLLDNYNQEVKGKNVILIPMIASFVMVMWDLCTDPILSTIKGEWVWPTGGYYFGVPMSNFFGWFFTVFSIYLVFALFLSRFRVDQDVTWSKSKSFWLVVPLMYFGLAIQFILSPFFTTTNPTIYWSIFLISIYTMVFVSIISLLHINQKFNK